MITLELHYLTASAALAALMWIPYVLNRIAVGGINDAIGYPANPKPLAPWADRLKKAHLNHIENLVPFAAVVLVADVGGLSNGSIAMAGALFFYSRLVYALAYTFAVPWVRTLSFTGGWLAIIWIMVEMCGMQHAMLPG